MSNETEAALTDQDREDLRKLGIELEDGPQHSLLRIWSEVLSNVDEVADENIPLNVAMRVVASWPQLTLQETSIYHDIFHQHLREIRDLLTKAIEDNPGAIDIEGDEDATENWEIYKQLVVDWNVLLDKYERTWVADDPHSHILAAAMIDARAFLFARTGFAGHLEARGLEFSSDEIAQAILEAREEQE